MLQERRQEFGLWYAGWYKRMIEGWDGVEVWSQFDGTNSKQTMHVLYVQFLFMIDSLWYITILYKYFTYIYKHIMYSSCIKYAYCLRPSHTGVRFDTVTRGRSKSHAPEISGRKRRQASVIVHFQAVTASLFAATASIRRLPRINFWFKNSWPSVAVRGSPIIRESA